MTSRLGYSFGSCSPGVVGECDDSGALTWVGFDSNSPSKNTDCDEMSDRDDDDDCDDCDGGVPTVWDRNTTASAPIGWLQRLG